MIEEADVIVLEADGTVDSSGNGYGYQIINQLKKHGYQATLVPIIANINNLDLLPDKPLIISGGMTEVTSEVGWLNEFKRFINEKMNNDTKILGICFGAQLLAECNQKGSVTYLEPPNMGISDIHLNQSDHSLFNGLNHPFQAFSFHYNQIISENVEILSSHQKGNRNFAQAFEIPGTLSFGVQFHPELQLESFVKLVRNYKLLIEDNLGVKVDDIISDLNETQQDVSIIFKNFMEYGY